MNHTVKDQKTLLVDGPASVSLISGRVEVFGFMLRNRMKVVVREGKRLPFAVKEEAELDISLGEGAHLDKIEGYTIPSSWTKAVEEISNREAAPLTAMVIGSADSGKTSFCTFLINKLLNKREKTAILDGDLGQSDIGPPTTVSYAFPSHPVTDLFNLRAEDAFFIGATSPSRFTHKMIKGLNSLNKKILARNPDLVIINTDGWVEGDEAVDYKLKLIQEIAPDIVFCLEREDELDPLLNNMGEFRKLVVDSPSAVRHRSKEKRRSLRELGYVKYLRNSKVISIPINWLKIEGNGFIELGSDKNIVNQAGKIREVLGVKPLHLAELQDNICMVLGRKRRISPKEIERVEEITDKEVRVVHNGEEVGLITALYDGEGRWLGIGLLDEIDYHREVVKILTPVSSSVSAVELGRLKLDKNFRETSTFKE